MSLYLTYVCKLIYSKLFYFDIHGSVHLGNTYIRLQVRRDAHGFFMYSLLHYTCSTCFWCYLHPSSGAQTAQYSLRYAWLLWCVGSWIVHCSRLRRPQPAKKFCICRHGVSSHRVWLSIKRQLRCWTSLTDWSYRDYTPCCLWGSDTEF
jgi:hypothetical protein